MDHRYGWIVEFCEWNIIAGDETDVLPNRESGAAKRPEYTREEHVPSTDDPGHSLLSDQLMCGLLRELCLKCAESHEVMRDFQIAIPKRGSKAFHSKLSRSDSLEA
jgi:hypothetical protein